MERHSVPLIGEFKEDLYADRDKAIAKLFVDIDLKTSPKQAKYYLNRVEKAAKEFQDKIITTWGKKSNHDREVQDYNLQDEKVALVIEHKGDKYRMDDKFAAETVQKFYQDFLDGKLKKYVKSQKIPEKQEGNVKTIVGLNFDEIVNNPEKDVFISFTAPWCGHCKALKPKFEELATKVKDVDSLVIGNFDATANDYDRSRFEVSGYPTVYLVPAKEGAKPIKYEGDREVDAMYKFLKKKAAKKIGKSK